MGPGNEGHQHDRRVHPGVALGLKFADYVPIIFTSAKTGQRVGKILELALDIAVERKKRIATPELNSAMQEAFAVHPPPWPHGAAGSSCCTSPRRGIEPPTFVFFVNDPKLLHFSYQRYLENQIRAKWGFHGTAIRLVFRARSEKE